MRAINIVRRHNWQSHIRDNSYQADVLSDAQQKYWVEALPQAFAIQFDRGEEQAIATATEALAEMCIDFLDWFFGEGKEAEIESRLATLKIHPAYWQAIKNSWQRTEPVEDLALGMRFDLAVTETGEIKLLEINAETPLLGAETVYQWNWFVDYMHNYQHKQFPLPADASQFNQYWELVAGQWRRINEMYDLRRHGIAFLVDENLEEDLEMAMQLIQIIADEVDPDIYTQIVYLRGLKDDLGIEIQRGLGIDEEGYFIDGANDRIPILWKMYDWQDLQNDLATDEVSTQALAERLEVDGFKVIEPLWKQVLANKGAMAMMWEQFGNSEYGHYLLPTYFDTDNSIESTKLLLSPHVKKPLLGLEGAGISIESGYGAIEEKESFGYGMEGFIVQEYIELPEAFGYYYVIGSWAIDGEAAGIIIRGDTSKITGRHCLIIPHIVSDL
jgi:glutathionylspermidine synthase